MNALTTKQESGKAVDHLIHFEIERFLIREARLLDEERYHEWFEEMVSQEIIYQMPMAEVRYRRDQKMIGNSQTTYIFNDNYQILGMRIAKGDTGMVWAEDPKIRTRRHISNIDVEWSDNPDEVNVVSAFIVNRSSNQRSDRSVSGRRDDVLRKKDGQWQLIKRVITVDQRVTRDKNLNYFI